MTVGSDVKNCYIAIKSAEASLAMLSVKTNNNTSKEQFKQAENMLAEIKDDLQQQVLFLSREEPQYK